MAIFCIDPSKRITVSDKKHNYLWAPGAGQKKAPEGEELIGK
jgi:hypothetical protein